MATGTVVDVVMPQMGVSVSEGTITRWMKQVGEHIEADETIVEISTDKVDTEVPSPASGIVREILANDGDTVPVNTRIAVIAVGDAGDADAPADTAPPAATDNAEETPATPETSQTMSSQPAPEPQAANGSNGERRRRLRPHLHLAGGRADAGRAPTGREPDHRHRKRRPRDQEGRAGVHRLGRRPGRAGDPRRAALRAARRGAARRQPACAAARGTGSAAARRTAPAAAAPAPPAPATQQALVASGGDEELYQFNTIRKVIARHMRHSLDTAAHVTTVIEVDMTGVVNLRKKWKPEYQKRYGVNLTYIPFIARATIDAIGSWPWVNAEVQGETALIKKYVNLGMAVAVDDSKGLMVPVIHHAEEMNLVGLSRAVIEMAEKARTKTLSPDEMAGGSFTITNPGVFGALMGTPIIPEGQVAILDVEAIVKRPVVVSDRHGNDSIAIRHMMFLCLSYDHRLVDGAYAAQFMAQIKASLESWDEQAFGL